MAITVATKLSDFSGALNPEQSGPIFEVARRTSTVQQLAKKTPLGINGQSIPVTTGRLTPGWVDEAGVKPASAGALTMSTMVPKKIAVIAVVSKEVVRANPGGYMQEIQGQVGEAFGRAFDLAAMYDQSAAGVAAGGPFTTYLAQTTKTVELGTGETVYDDLVAGLTLLVNDNKRLTGFALDDRIEPMLLSAKDANDRPLFIDLPQDFTSVPTGADLNNIARQGRLMNRTSYMNNGIYSGTDEDIEGIGGDWSKCAWGAVGGITYNVSTQAAVTINGSLQSLWERNLVAVLAEAEYGFVCADVDSFVLYRNAS